LSLVHEIPIYFNLARSEFKKRKHNRGTSNLLFLCHLEIEVYTITVEMKANACIYLDVVDSARQ